MEDRHMHGSITVITGPMFAGKTSRLLRLVRQHREDGQEVLIFKPAIDKRSGDHRVVTHDDDGEAALVVAEVGEIFTHLITEHGYRVIAIDEAQFFHPKTLLLAVKALSGEGIQVIVAISWTRNGMAVIFLG